MAKTFRDWNTNQDYLFPPSLKEFVRAGHVSHFIVKLVKEELDLSEIYKSYENERGYPPHSPEMMTAVLLYGYIRGEYSSRKLSQACEERTDFMMVSGMSRPDHRPISRFRTRHADALKKIFEQIVRLCDEAGLIKLKHVSIDGTKIKANASTSQNMSYEEVKNTERELVERWFQEAQKIDNEEDGVHGEKRGDEFPSAVEALERVRAAKEEIERRDKRKRKERQIAEKEGTKPRSRKKVTNEPSDEIQYNLTDPDSGLMRSRQGFIQGYNAQLAVDAENQIIVACDVSSAKNDLEELAPMVEKVEANLQRRMEELSADTGYCSTTNLELLKKKKIRGYIPKSSHIANTGVIKEMTQRLQKGARRSRYRLRKQVVEPVFGIMKAARNFLKFQTKGLTNVKTEWALVSAAHNLLKLIKVRDCLE